MLTAKCINSYSPWPKENLPIIEGDLYEVESIDMGQSFTFVKLKGIDKLINSVCLKFYENGKKIDIFKDKRYNPYL